VHVEEAVARAFGEVFGLEVRGVSGTARDGSQALSALRGA